MRGNGPFVLVALSACACLPRGPHLYPVATPALSLDMPAASALPPLMGPFEVATELKASGEKYVLVPVPVDELPAPERLALEIWLPATSEIQFPMVKVNQGGQRLLYRYPANEAADRLIVEAEPHWRERRFAEAAALYRRALKIQPDYYPALLDLGDVASGEGNLEEAVARYDRAIRANPADHRGHFLRGNALADLGRTEKALDAYATALALRPRHPRVLDGIEDRQGKLGIHVVRGLFSPRGLARQTSRGTEVHADTEGTPHWAIWAACKALWMMEEDHRLKMTGLAEHRFSVLEEVECLGVLLQGYLVMRTQGKVEEEPELDRLGRIAAAGQLPELVLYELASRKSPHVVVHLDDARRAKMERFVRRFVFEREGAGPEREAAR